VKFTESTRKLIRQRAKSRCELCGVTTEKGQIHHRKPRGMGGTVLEESRSAANGLYLDLKCHEKIERNRREAYENGWLVHRWDNSEERAVKMFDGWFVLAGDGTLSPLSPR
jgi:5-methylcytosine-specific restriction protein A